MSILIKGAKMPTNCIECLSTLGLFSTTCPISDDSNIDVEFARNHIYDGCPLAEIPPHGELIDRNKLDNIFWDILSKPDEYDKPLHDMMLELQIAPTVIEGEEE